MFEALRDELKAMFTSEVKKVHDSVNDLHSEVVALPVDIEARLVGAFKEVQDMTKNELIAALNGVKTEIEAKFTDLKAQIAAKDTTIKGLQDAAASNTEDSDLSSVGDVVKGISDSLKDDPEAEKATGTGFDSVQKASTTADKPPVVMSQLPASTLAASGGITDENPGLTPSPVANTTA